MKDERGLYYYPFPANKRIRTYVREADGEMFFRLWNSDDPKLWEEHDWVPWEAIRQAAAMYTSGKFKPDDAYDIVLARELMREGKSS
jgi:8-oxo-dGTP pyrophosphatase MutT (NUDIX family)